MFIYNIHSNFLSNLKLNTNMAKNGKSHRKSATKDQPKSPNKPGRKSKNKSPNKPKTKSKGNLKKKSKSNSRTKRKTKKSKSKSSNNSLIKPTEGLHTKDSLLHFSFWNTIFQKYHIKHQYKGKGGDIFAELIIFKEPENNVRGYIEFFIDGPITMDRVDIKNMEAVHRITVGVNDKIMFYSDDSRLDEKIVTKIDYVPKYQLDEKNKKTDKGSDYGVVSDDRKKDVVDIFSWLEHTYEPKYFEDILKKVTIEKGMILKDKEKLKPMEN